MQNKPENFEEFNCNGFLETGVKVVNSGFCRSYDLPKTFCTLLPILRQSRYLRPVEDQAN